MLYCRPPEGVHSHMLEHVDLKKLTKLIKRGRLAPLYPHELDHADAAEVRRTIPIGALLMAVVPPAAPIAAQPCFGAAYNIVSADAFA